jgi:hypothetical protein
MAPQTVTTGVPELDALTGGLPRGALSEITGLVSSGRTGVMISALAAATRRQEMCALVDASDSFDPASAQAAGVDIPQLLWVRCSEQGCERNVQALSRRAQRKALTRLDQVLRVTDLLLQSGGFGMVVLDMGDIPAESTRRVPLTSWFRFRRAVEPTATVLLLIEQEPCAKTCASLVVQLRREAICAQNAVPQPIQAAKEFALAHASRQGTVSQNPQELCCASFVSGHDFSRAESALNFTPRERISARERSAVSATSHNVGLHSISYPSAIPANNAISHAALFQGLHVNAEVVRSWTRKPVQSAHAVFDLSAKHSVG